MPLSTLAVAQRIGHDRRVLKKYGLDERIIRASKERAQRTKAGKSQRRRLLEERIEVLEKTRSTFERQWKAALGQIALMEGNAKRLGFDPEELYKPLLPPDRRVSAIVKRDRQRNGRL